LRNRQPDTAYDLLMARHQELAHILDQIKVVIEEVAADRQVTASLTKPNGV
jgi:hypothetical protein